MFRIFLKKKIFSGEESNELIKPTRSSYRRNRRIYERYNVTQQHLTILNDQDILVIREISPKGFSSDVSPRAFERFTKGDVYEGRIRYMGELHDFNIRVAWKRKKVVGFEIVKASSEGTEFLNRLMRPVDVSQSLREVSTLETPETDGKKVSFQGEEGTRFTIWYNEVDEVDAWRLSVDGEFVEWSNGKYRTGRTETSDEQEDDDTDFTFNVDKVNNNSQVQFGIDVIMTLESIHRKKLIAAIGES